MSAGRGQTFAMAQDDEVFYYYDVDDDGRLVPDGSRPVFPTSVETVLGSTLSGEMEAAGGEEEELSALMKFNVWYQGVHGYVCVVICLFGIISNAMNIAVLTRRTMITPTNHLLTALAIADLLTMVFYLPYAIYFYCITVPDPGYGHPAGWVVYLLFNIYFTITAHTAAMWLTVALAVFRYVVVCCDQALGARLCTLQRAKVAIAAVFVATPIFCSPNYIMYRVISLEDPTGNATASLPAADVTTPPETAAATPSHANSSSSPAEIAYWFDKTTFVPDSLTTVNFWLFGVFFKVVPCILLAVLSGLLVAAMRRAAAKRRRLRSAGRRDDTADRDVEHARTTAMLVAVVLCFVAAELPQGVLAFLSGVDTRIFDDVYVPLGDVFDVVVLINSAVNFVLYCTMSRQFRQTFGELFLGSSPAAASAAASGSVNRYKPAASTRAARV